MLNGLLINGSEHSTAAASAQIISDDEFFAFIDRANRRNEADRIESEKREWQREMCDLLRGKLAVDLADELEALRSKSPSTKRVYAGDCKRFKEACDQVRMPFRPAAPEMVASFLLSEFNEGASVNSINRLVAAIGYAHTIARMVDPTEDILVRAAVKNVAKRAADKKPADETPKEH